MKVALMVLWAGAAFGQPYRVERVDDRGLPVVRLVDAAHEAQVSVVPSVGNRAIEMKVRGRDVLYFPYAGAAEFAERPRLSGVPFLAPWADLLDEQAFWANGKRYAFNMELGNVRGTMPSHGLLVNAKQWEVVEAAADARSAWVTSRLAFWKYPELVAQWPFAQEYEMTYRLSEEALEVRTTVRNLSDEAMPLAIGFHPYFQIAGVPRDEWVLRSPARVHVIPGEHNIPTGEMRPMDLPKEMPLRGRTSDDGFTDLERDAEGRARYRIEGGGEWIEVALGPKYTVATVWIPEGREYLCVEPLTTIIDGVNLAHAGKWNGLQTVAGRGTWTESFWVRAGR